MMGLKDKGSFDIDDFWFTVNSGDYDEKKEANIAEIKKRISDYGIGGMVVHLARKVSWSWWDGTYFIPYYLKNGSETPVKVFVRESKIFIAYCSIYHFIILFLILFSFIHGAFSKIINYQILFKIIICGVFFFFVIWEARSRYLVNFTPLFIIAAVSSIKCLSSALDRKRKLKKV